MVEAPGKARHSVSLLLAATALADCAPEDIQQRSLARYAFLYGEAALVWLRRWRNQLKREPASAHQAKAAKPSVDRLAEALLGAAGVRHYLAAKRQPAAEMRADDIEATRLLWTAVNAANVQAIGSAAIDAYEGLRGPSNGAPIVDFLGLPAACRRDVSTALPRRDNSRWYVAADTAADLRPYTLPVAAGGELGRRIAQINDVAAHLDTLLAIAPVLDEVLVYDWLVRSAMVVELSALLDLALGPPPNHPRKVLFSLLDLCHRERTEAACEELRALREAIGGEGWDFVRSARNRLGAHVDGDLRMLEIQEHLLYMDFRGITRLARHVLNALDCLGARCVDLKLLLLGERRIQSWPTDPDRPARLRPDRPILTGTLSNFFRRLDSPFMAVAGSSLGSAVIMGITAGRRPEPRPETDILDRRPKPYLEPIWRD